MIRSFGDRGLLVELDGPAAAQLLDADLRRDPIPGLLGTVPGMSSLLLELDPSVADAARVVAQDLEARASRLDASPLPGRERVIPVVYGGDDGPDLPGVAALTGLAEAEVIARHAAAELRVLFGGFAPGFAYIGDLPAALQVPRLVTPRTRTAAGSVAIAGPMTGIYPATLPGGWRVIGRTPIAPFDPRRDPPVYLSPGDTVRFRPIEREAWDAHAGPPADW
jgi:KipI family sensor histidine kinase inhibitor